MHRAHPRPYYAERRSGPTTSTSPAPRPQRGTHLLIPHNQQPLPLNRASPQLLPLPPRLLPGRMPKNAQSAERPSLSDEGARAQLPAYPAAACSTSPVPGFGAALFG